MMQRTRLLKFLLTTSSIVLLAACTNNNQSEEENSQAASSNTAASSESSAESSQASGDQSASSSPQQSSSSSAASSSASDPTSDQDQNGDIADRLAMDSSKVLLPSDFPAAGAETVNGKILVNEANHYAVRYFDSKQTLVEVAGKQMHSAAAVQKEINANTPAFENVKQNAVDLGHGMTGSGQGAAGNQYFNWQEGNWQFFIHTLSQDNIDSTNIARQIVTYLEQNYLPAPDTLGKVMIEYALGGDQVNVEIYLQKGSMLYQLQTSNVPIDALGMTVSLQNPTE